MTDFETHPVGEIARLEAYLARRRKSLQTDYEDIHSYDAGCATEAVLLASDIEALIAALTRANAATAAAYEVAARLFDDGVSPTGKAVGDVIRALATPDQTAALDRLIAEAEARVWAEAAEIAAKSLERAPDNEGASGWTVSTARLNAICLQAGEWAKGAYLETVECIALVVEKECANAILAASKKGGA